MDRFAFEQTFRGYLDKYDYSQARLARHLHVSRSTVSKWITGENQISYEMLYQLCDLFDLDAAERADWLVLAGYPPLVEPQSAAPRPLKRQAYDAILYREPGNLRKPTRLFGAESMVDTLLTQWAEARQLLITGYGGTGKTALAATLADQRLTVAQGPMLWLNAHGSEIATLFEALVVPFGAHHELMNLRGDARLYAVKQILTREAVDLIVLDDLQEVQLFTQIQRAIPDRVLLLITSRHTIANIELMVSVPPLPAQAAINLLASHAANRAIPEAAYQRDRDAQTLCAKLANYPLGIVIAGAWLKQRQLAVGELLARMQSPNTDLLTLELPPEFREEGSATVKVVLDQTYRALSKEGQGLFRSFGVLQEPQCTADFLAQFGEWDEWKLYDTLEELVAWNFLERGAETLYKMHDVVHSYAEYRTRTIRHVDTKRLVESVQQYVATHATDFGRLHQNLPNILYAAEGAPDAASLSIMACLALEGYQEHFGYRLSYLDLLDRAIAYLAVNQGAGSATPAANAQLHHLLCKRANAYFDQTDYRAAVETYQWALAVVYNEERRATVFSLLGKALRFAGEKAGAEHSFQQAYQIARAMTDSYLLSFILEQHAHAAGFHGDHTTARRVAAEQVDLNEALVQADPTPQNQICFFYALNNLATAELHVGQKGLHEILQIGQRAAALAQLIDNEEMIAHAAWALTEIYHALGNRDKATYELYKALNIYEAQGKLLDAEQIRQFISEHGYDG